MEEQDTVYDHLVIGGGISGLGLAHLCVRRGLRTLVLERDAQVGGCIHSHRFPKAGGYWVEMGSHTCYNSYGHLLGIVADLNLAPSLLPKAKVSFRVLQPDGGLDSVFSRLHPLELGLSLPRLFTEKKTGKSVAEYYGRVLGRRNYQDLFGPAFNAVICQPADDFPADMLFRRKPRRKDMPRSFTLADGLGHIPAAIADQPGLQTLCGDGAVRIDRDTKGFRVTTGQGRQFSARHLSLALPPDLAAALLADGFPALAEPLGRIRMAEIESVAVVIPADALQTPPLAGIIAAGDSFYAAVSRDYLDDTNYRGLTFHFRPDRLDEPGQLRRICDVLHIDQDRIVATARRRNRLPALRAGHGELLQELDRVLPGTGLGITGNFFLGVSIEDCLTRSASEFQRLFAR